MIQRLRLYPTREDSLGVSFLVRGIGHCSAVWLKEFGNILLKVNPDGSQVRLHDVATINLGGENYSTDTR
jgi:Cu/Ag efflux pump CusA